MAVLFALFATACDGTVRVGADQSVVAADGDTGPPIDSGPPGDQRPEDRGAAIDGVYPCSPLPAGCLCPQACSSGSCDNTKCPCQAISGVGYGTLSTKETFTGDVSKHGDVNLLLRKWQPVSAVKGLIDVSGPTDTKPPPQLYTLFTDDRVPGFSGVYQVEYWDWGCNCPNGYITEPEVTLAGMAATPGEVIQAPMSGYTIGGGQTAMVLYAAKHTITLKYTVEDNVVKGYTVHLSGVCVEPSLQALYDQCNAAGRTQLPALKSRQPLGRAVGTEIQAAIRDTGSWMDPRARKDWWQGK